MGIYDEEVVDIFVQPPDVKNMGLLSFVVLVRNVLIPITSA